MKLGDALNKTAVTRIYRPSAKLPLPTCLTGVEVEVEGVEDWNREIEAYWQRVRDDSLRGNGAEFVLRDPLFGEDLLLAISMLCKCAKENEWTTSYRTSIHVHMDVRDLSFPAFRALCCIYAIVEPVLFHWIGDKRSESVFCLPWYSAEGDIDKIRSMFTAQGPELTFKSDSVNRYSALNLKALAKQGSIEFRHMRTTFDEARIVSWIQMCQHVRRFAEILENTNRLDTYLLEMYSSLKMKGFLEEVFGATLATMLLENYSGPTFTPGILLCQDLLSNEVQKKLGLIFCPPNSFLKVGSNKFVKLWKKVNKTKKAEKQPPAVAERAVPGAQWIVLDDAIAATPRRRWEAPAPPPSIHVTYSALTGNEGSAHAWMPTDTPHLYAAWDIRNECFFQDEQGEYLATVFYVSGASERDRQAFLTRRWRRIMEEDRFPVTTLVCVQPTPAADAVAINNWS